MKKTILLSAIFSTFIFFDSVSNHLNTSNINYNINNNIIFSSKKSLSDLVISPSFAEEVKIEFAPNTESYFNIIEGQALPDYSSYEFNDEKEEFVEPVVVSKYKRAASALNLNRLKMACHEGCNINSVIYDGNTILHLAASANNYDVYYWALEQGAQWSVNDLGQTPMHLAAMTGNADLIDLVYQNYEGKKPVMSLTDKNGQTPAFYLMKNTNLKSPAIEFFFSLPNTQCNVFDKNNFAPLHHLYEGSFYQNYESIIKYCDIHLKTPKDTSRASPLEQKIEQTTNSIHYEFYQAVLEKYFYNKKI